MKTIGIISDIHANLKALEKALGILREAAVDAVLVCGDIIGYGIEVNECCDLIREMGCPVVVGNHESAVIGHTNYRERFTPRARRGIEYALENLSRENIRWLVQLPLQISIGKMEFVHASLVDPEHFYYLTLGKPKGESVYQDVRESFKEMNGQVCFVGHTHKPVIFLEETLGQVKVVEATKQPFSLVGQRAIIDVGSVGAPRNDSQKASLAIFDSEQQQICFKMFQ